MIGVRLEMSSMTEMWGGCKIPGGLLLPLMVTLLLSRKLPEGRHAKVELYTYGSKNVGVKYEMPLVQDHEPFSDAAMKLWEAEHRKV